MPPRFHVYPLTRPTFASGYMWCGPLSKILCLKVEYKKVLICYLSTWDLFVTCGMRSVVSFVLNYDTIREMCSIITLYASYQARGLSGSSVFFFFFSQNECFFRNIWNRYTAKSYVFLTWILKQFWKVYYFLWYKYFGTFFVCKTKPVYVCCSENWVNMSTVKCQEEGRVSFTVPKTDNIVILCWITVSGAKLLQSV